MGNLDHVSQKKLQLQRKRQASIMKKRARKRRWKRVKKAFLLLLLFVVVFLLFDGEFSFQFKPIKFDSIHFDGIKLNKIKFNFNWFQKKDKKEEKKTHYLKSELDGKIIAYVPIDDRMIHTTRMEYLAESMGYDLRLPDSKYYKTNIDKADNSYAGYNTKYGNPVKIASWLAELEEEGCDYYILSLDQMFSGGLVGSQYLSDSDFDVYGKGISASKKQFEKIVNDSNNHVYLIDSVMGLSVTPGFLDFTADDYAMLVSYTNSPRKVLSGDDLTISNIADQYSLDVNGASISTALNVDKLHKYLKARERKLSYSKYILKTISNSKNKKNIHLYYGIDDYGNSTQNIQNNDLLYLQNLINQYSLEIPIREGVSSLSEVAFGDMMLDSLSDKIRVKVSYYGYPKKVVSNGVTASSFMDSLLADLDLSKVEEKPDFEVLIYNSVDDIASREGFANSLLNHYLNNVRDKIPTVIINDATLSQDLFLIENLSNYDKTSIPMGYLIGYSNWNGFVHSSRLGLVEGISRIIYLKGKKKDDKMDKGFLKVMGQSYIEDMGYLLTSKTNPDINAVTSQMMDRINKINKNLQSSNYISDLVPYDENGIRQISVSKYYYPWSRTNEITFEVSSYLGDPKGNVIPENVVYKEG